MVENNHIALNLQVMSMKRKDLVSPTKLVATAIHIPLVHVNELEYAVLMD